MWDWYSAFPDKILDLVEMYFDANEGFMGHLLREWRNDKFKRAYPSYWNLVRSMTPADSRTVPPLQVADMIAWARNRINSSAIGDKFIQRAHSIVGESIRGKHFIANRKSLEKLPVGERGSMRFQELSKRFKDRRWFMPT
jgi:hypothetical protein